MQLNEIRRNDTKWNAAIYVRISEEERRKELSNSIENQKSILTGYAKNKEISIHKIYEDDGYSGGNFKRPGFRRMIQSVDNKTINCIIVKDLSRFGREHIEGDFYLEKYFPEKGIRFISLHENLDSLKDPVRMNSIEIPLINIFNEQYLRQVSNATKASLKLKRKEGLFVGSIPPYGYIRSPEDKYMLIIDEEIRYIVEKIYKDYLSYNNMSNIADELNAMNILSPANHRRWLNQKPIKDNSKWTSNTIKIILIQQIYTGDMVQGKTLSYNHKVHRREVLAEDKWDIVENTHEAIISKADFEKVQALLNGKTKSTKSLFNTKPSIFAGVLVCSDCGKKMVRSTSKSNGVVYNKFICSTYKKHGVEVCSCHLIQEEALEEIVKEALNKLVFDIVDLDKRLKKATEKEKSKNIIILEKSKKVYEKQSKDIMSLKMELYKDYKLGNITLDEFQDMKAGFYKKYNQSEQNLNSIENQILSLNSKNYIDEKMMERIRPYLDGIHQLTRKMVIDFIDEILVDNDKNIRMKFKFIDELKNIVLFLNNK